MLKILQKHAPTISILLLIALIIALFISKPSARLLSTIIIVFGIGTAILFIIHNNWEKHKNNEQTHPEFIHNSIIDLLGLALVMGSAVWLGRLTGTYVELAWGNTSTWLNANLAGIIVAMAVSFIAAFLIGKIWRKVAEPVKASS